MCGLSASVDIDMPAPAKTARLADHSYLIGWRISTQARGKLATMKAIHSDCDKGWLAAEGYEQVL